ncbi:MAG: electron transport complex protein RnfG [Bacteroidia bacterium]|jgi:electron transport complex protein RnfG
MSEPATISTNSNKMLLAMVSIGVICAVLIVATFEGTKPRIERLRAEALQKAIFRVIPGTVKTITFQLNNGSFKELTNTEKSDQLVYAGYGENNELTGIAVEAAGQGYADIIRILYGYNPESETIVGLYVLESKETPGLGDRIEKDPVFLSNFDALDVSLNSDHSNVNNQVVTMKKGAKENPWEVDGITGATISSRAIGNILGESSQNWIPLIYKNKEAFKLTLKEKRQ